MIPREGTSYFCPIGCGVFKYRGQILNHLLEHTTDELKVWGIHRLSVVEEHIYKNKVPDLPQIVRAPRDNSSSPSKGALKA